MMNSLQLLITGNKPDNLADSLLAQSESSSQVDYDLFLNILSYLELNEKKCTKLVSRLWYKATAESLTFLNPFLEKLNPESIINIIRGNVDKDANLHIKPMENNDAQLYQREGHLNGMQNDLKLLSLCKAQIKERNYDNAIKLSSNVLTMKLKTLIHEKIDLAIWKDSKELAEIGLTEEAFEKASKILDNEVRELAIQDIYDSEQEFKHS